MNAQSLIDILRSDYLYDVSEPYRWSDAFLLRSLLEAERQACNRWHLIYDDSTTAIAKIALKDGTPSYTLSSKITEIEKFTLNGADVVKMSKADLDANDPTWRIQTGIKGVPVRAVIRNRTITFSPSPLASKDATFIQSTTPSGAVVGNTWFNSGSGLLYSYNGSSWVTDSTATLATVYLETYRLPLSDTITTSYAFEIAEEHLRKLIHWVLHEAYMKKDADGIENVSYDPQRAQLELAKFNEYFGVPVSAAVRQNQLEEPKTATIRPIAYASGMTSKSWDIDSDWE